MTSLTTTTFFRTAQLLAASLTALVAVWALPANAQTASPDSMSNTELAAEVAERLQQNVEYGDYLLTLDETPLYRDRDSALAGDESRIRETVPESAVLEVRAAFDGVVYTRYEAEGEDALSGYVAVADVVKLTRASRDVLLPESLHSTYLMVGDRVTLMKAIDGGGIVGQLPAGLVAMIVNTSNDRVRIQFDDEKRVWTESSNVRLGVVDVEESTQPAEAMSFSLSDVESIAFTKAFISRTNVRLNVPQYVLTLTDGKTVNVNVSPGANRDMVKAALVRAGYTGNTESLLSMVTYAGGKRSSYNDPILTAANTVTSVPFTSDDIELIVSERSTYVGSGPYDCPEDACEMIYTISLQDGTVLYTFVKDADSRDVFNNGNLATALQTLGLSGDVTSVVDSVKRVIRSTSDISNPLQPQYTANDIKYVTLDRGVSNSIRYTIVTDRNFIIDFTPSLTAGSYLDRTGLRGAAYVPEIMDMGQFVNGEDFYFSRDDIQTIERMVDGNEITYAITLTDNRVVHTKQRANNPAAFEYGDYAGFRNALIYAGYQGAGYTIENAKRIAGIVTTATTLPEETEVPVEEEAAVVDEPIVEDTEVEVVVVTPEPEAEEEAAGDETEVETEEDEEVVEALTYRIGDIESVTKRTVGDCTIDACHYLYTITLEDSLVINVRQGARTSESDFRRAVRDTGYRGSFNSFLDEVKDVEDVKPNTADEAESESEQADSGTDASEPEDEVNEDSDETEEEEEPARVASYRLNDVDEVTVQSQGDVDVYTITLDDDAVVVVEVPKGSSSSRRNRIFQESGYKGFTSLLVRKARPSVSETEASSSTRDDEDDGDDAPENILETLFNNQQDDDEDEEVDEAEEEASEDTDTDTETSNSGRTASPTDVESLRSILRTFGFVLGQSINIHEVLSEVRTRLEAMR